MAEANKTANKEKNLFHAENKNHKENLDRKDKRVTKLKETIETYRSSTLKLVHTVESELERLKFTQNDQTGLDQAMSNIKWDTQLAIDITNEWSEMSPGRSPMPHSHGPAEQQHDQIWFDIEKSQERYEAMLDSYQNIIKDKDIYLKQVEEELAAAKHERLDLEDQHFKVILAKDELIAKAEGKWAHLENTLESLKSDLNGKLDDLRGEN